MNSNQMMALKNTMVIVVNTEDSFHGWVFFVEIPDLKRLNLNIVKVLRFCFLATINS